MDERITYDDIHRKWESVLRDMKNADLSFAVIRIEQMMESAESLEMAVDSCAAGEMVENAAEVALYAESFNPFISDEVRKNPRYFDIFKAASSLSLDDDLLNHIEYSTERARKTCKCMRN